MKAGKVIGRHQHMPCLDPLSKTSMKDNPALELDCCGAAERVRKAGHPIPSDLVLGPRSAMSAVPPSLWLEHSRFGPAPGYCGIEGGARRR